MADPVGHQLTPIRPLIGQIQPFVTNFLAPGNRVGILDFMKMQNGFSLVELIVTVAIAAIVVSVGIPSLQSSMRDNRQSTAVNELSSALQMARSSAISRRERVTVCKSPDGLNCVAANDWTQGWIVFADPNNPNVRDNAEEILHVHSAVRGNVTIAGDPNNDVENLIAFQPQGMLASAPGTITHCDPRGVGHATGLVISRGGQIHFEGDGTQLSC